MDFLDLAKSRHSVRSYRPDKVEAEKVASLVEAARVAPTAANLQPARLVVAQSAASLEAMGAAANLYGAPLAFVVCVDRSRAWVRPFDGKSTADIDAAIACDHLMMQATSLGLGSVWICYFKPDKLKQALSIPAELDPVNILAVGYTDEPASDPRRYATDRIPADELIVATA